MGMTAPLVSSNDGDWQLWQSGDPSTFLSMACAEVQKFCGWHVAPSVTFTDRRCWVMQGNLVMLQSTYVTAISSVVVGGGDTGFAAQTLVADTDYAWDPPKGWLRLYPTALNIPNSGIYSPAGTYSQEPLYASITYDSGYPETPMDVKAVIFELVATATELPASNATEVMTEHYRYNLKPTVGISLSEDQKYRLGHYKIRKFGGLVRP